MAILDIVTYPDPRLRETTVAVEKVDEGIRTLVRDLTDTMFASNGAGIAAIQVGRFERIFLIDGQVAGGAKDSEPLVFINPELVESGRGFEISDEGCLSFPGVFVQIKRPRWAKIRAMNLAGQIFEAEGDGLFGRALQHEFDHLNGKLMLDMVGTVKKEVIKRKMNRWHAERGPGQGRQAAGT